MSTPLTARQRQVVDLVITGLPSKEVGKRLFICEKAVKEHLCRIYRAENVKSRAELICKYKDKELLEYQKSHRRKTTDDLLWLELPTPELINHDTALGLGLEIIKAKNRLAELQRQVDAFTQLPMGMRPVEIK